jgi:hypothetical protein
VNTRDEMALRLHQTSRRHPEIETLMDEFFGRIVTAAQYEEIQSCVHEIFTAPQPIFLSDLPCHVSEAL